VKEAALNRSLIAGVPLDVVRESSVAGELSARDFERVINTLRDETGRMGTTLARTREIAWQCGGLGQHLSASVVPDRGRTSIRLSRSVRRMVVGSSVVAAWSSGIVGFSVAAISHRIAHLPGPGWGIRPSHDALVMMSGLLGVLSGLGVFPVWRAAVGRIWRGKVRELDALAARLANKIRESIDEEKQQ
jgi:hypothetical protein